MNFVSDEFFVFFAVVLLLYYILEYRAQNVMLLVASYVFYGWWDWRFLGLLFISTLTDFCCAIGCHRARHEARRKAYLLTSITVNLGILAAFKYYNFFVSSLVELGAHVGISFHASTWQIILPVGISFYTFQTLSYTIDVYRKQLTPCKDFFTFALYTSIFPQLVAGPIERATTLLPQLTAPRRVDFAKVSEAGLLILLGFFKKAGIADALAPMVDVVFASTEEQSGATLLVAIYLFSVQIYCDFSGYTDIARGTAKLLGIDLMINFNHPYFATSITDFWRRWHISLSTWLRDYLYIPLGGNRFGELKTYRNLILTMFLGGLWHGASWCFVVWGLFHGIYLALNKYWSEHVRPREIQLPWMFRGFTILMTFHLVVLTWVFFRSPSIGVAWEYLIRIVTWHSGKWFFGDLDVARCLILTGTLLAIEIVQYRSGCHTTFLQWPWRLQALFYAYLVILLVALGGLNADVPFIYFQF